MEKRQKIHEGKAKAVYSTDDPDRLIIDFTDTATAFDGAKRGTIHEKGRLNNLISALFFEKLAEAGIPTHYRGTLSDREMLVVPVEIVMVEMVVRNIATGSLCRRLPFIDGTELEPPLVELFYKDDSLGDPLINDDHALLMGLASREELAEMKRLSLAINDALRPYLMDAGIVLVDFKLEFGRYQGGLVLADEISPDTCRFWDASTKEKMDKDRFRKDMGKIEEAYQEIYQRLTRLKGD